jgi:exopolysaccharide biosynthesis WecB/TagA/CpsF family protein
MPYQYHTRAASVIKKLTLVRDDTEHAMIIDALKTPDQPLVVSFLNAHAFNVAWKESTFRRSLVESDILLRDGVGVSLLLKLLGIAPGINMNGTDLIPQVLAHCRGRIALLGTREPMLTVVAEGMAREGISVCATLDGFQPVEKYVELVRETRPAVVVLAMGMPKQENVALALKREIAYPCLIINGGAILDFLAGHVPRAPKVIRQIGMEWAFRLSLEPKRLGGRYVLGNSAFLFRSFRIWRSALRQQHGNRATLQSQRRLAG